MKEEGISLIQIESLASGTPFIAKVPPQNGEFRDVSIEADVNDCRDIKDKIIYFYNNKEKIRKKLMDKRNPILDNYRWEKRSAVLSGIYKNIEENGL